MTDKIFAVIRTRGPAWNDSQPLEGQDNWSAHADFMNGLVADGFALASEGERAVADARRAFAAAVSAPR